MLELIKHANCGADLTGRAIAALEAVGFDKGGLQRVQLIVIGDALDGRNLSALVLHGERETGVDAFAVRKHGAGAARALIAALLGPCQPDVFAQSVEQRNARLDLKFMLDAVDL